MTDPTPEAALSEPDDPTLEYRSVEPLAVVALLLGIVSPVAVVQPVMSFLPILGLVAAVIALVRIAGGQLASGRRLAIVGLVLSTIFLGLPLARYATVQWMLPPQARPVADAFLERLRAGHPEQAVLLEMAPDFRPPVDDGLWSYFRHDIESRNRLQTFVKQPFVRMLVELGPKADVRFYKTNAVGAATELAFIDFWYTVTFEDTDGKRKTILVGLWMERRGKPMNGELNPWRVREITTDLNLADTRI